MRSDDDSAAMDPDEPYDGTDSASPYTRTMYGYRWGWAWPPVRREGDEAETYAAADEGEDSWWDEGLITVLLVVGLVLFLFPEPATSGLGMILMLAGVVAWLIDALT